MGDVNFFATAFQNIRNAVTDQHRKASVVPGIFGLLSTGPSFLVLVLTVYAGMVLREDSRMVCVSDSGSMHPYMLSTCYYNAYTRPELTGNHGGYDVLVPGVGTPDDGKDNRKWREEFPKVLPFRIMLGIFGLLPVFLWKLAEGGNTNAICEIIQRNDFERQSGDDRKGKFVEAAQLFSIHVRGRYYFLGVYFLCNLLAWTFPFAWVMSSAYLFDWRIATLGLRVLGDGDGKIYVLDDLFPSHVHCQARRYGPSGNIQIHDAVCHYPLNEMLRYVFLLEWYVYAATVCVSVITIVGYFTSWCSLKTRVGVMASKMGKGGSRACVPVLEKVGPGGYFQLRLIQWNVNAVDFKRFLEVVDEELEGWSIC